MAGLSRAKALVDNRRWLDAAALYLELSQLVLPADASSEAREAQAQAGVERQRLLPRIPSVIIVVESKKPDAARVFVNEVAIPSSELGVPRRVDPGTLRVRGVQNGTSIETRVELAEAEVKPVRLSFEPTSSANARAPTQAVPLIPQPALVANAELNAPEPPSEAGEPRRLIAFVAMGVGGAALITGGVFGVMALRDEAGLRSRCPANTCPAALDPDVDAYESKKTITTVGLASGAVLAVGGAVLYFTSSGGQRRQTANLGAYYDGRQAGIWGAF